MLMSPLQMRVTLMDMGSQGLQIRSVLNSLSLVMDSVQVHHLALMLSNEQIIQEVGLVGAGTSVGEEMVEDLLAEDNGEVYDFKGNCHRARFSDFFSFMSLHLLDSFTFKTPTIFTFLHTSAQDTKITFDYSGRLGRTRWVSTRVSTIHSISASRRTASQNSAYKDHLRTSYPSKTRSTSYLLGGPCSGNSPR